MINQNTDSLTLQPFQKRIHLIRITIVLTSGLFCFLLLPDWSLRIFAINQSVPKMLEKGTAQYEPVTSEIQADYNQKEGFHKANADKKNFMSPRRLESLWSTKLLRTLFDLAVAVVSLLFAAYGFLAYKHEGEQVQPDSEAASIVSVAKYVCISNLYVPYNS